MKTLKRFVLVLSACLPLVMCSDSGDSEDNNDNDNEEENDNDCRYVCMSTRSDCLEVGTTTIGVCPNGGICCNTNNDEEDDSEDSDDANNGSCTGTCVSNFAQCDGQIDFSGNSGTCPTGLFCCVDNGQDTGEDVVVDCDGSCEDFFCPGGTTQDFGGTCGNNQVCCIDNGQDTGEDVVVDCDGSCESFRCPQGTTEDNSGTCGNNQVCCIDNGQDTGEDRTDSCEGQCFAACEGNWAPGNGGCELSGGVCCVVSDNGQPTDTASDEPTACEGTCVTSAGECTGTLDLLADCGEDAFCCIGGTPVDTATETDTGSSECGPGEKCLGAVECAQGGGTPISDAPCSLGNCCVLPD